MSFSPTSWPGGASGVGPSVGLATSAAVDIHATPGGAVLWDQKLDNLYDFNVISALPDGLGLTIPADGISGAITTTEAGIWALTFRVNRSTSVADAAVRGFIGETFAGTRQAFGPLAADGSLASFCAVLALPSGASAFCPIDITVAATNNPLNVEPLASIVRLA